MGGTTDLDFSYLYMEHALELPVVVPWPRCLIYNHELMNNILISICVPTYKRIHYLKRLLDSILSQTFQSYEVIITDNSPDDSVSELVRSYSGRINNLSYHKNSPPLSPTGNWNAAIGKARSQWVKLMHDDDWFSDQNSLQIFYNATIQNPDCNFFFSAFKNVIEGTDKVIPVNCNLYDRFFLSISRLHLFRRVYVGNPSCTLVKKDISLMYDEKYVFVVDFEYYMRYLKKYKNYVYIDSYLLNIGFHQEQLTAYTFRKPEVQIPENHLLFRNLSPSILNNVFVFDYYWRMYRNLNVRNLGDVNKYDSNEIPIQLKKIIEFQIKFSQKILQIGFISKTLMIAAYLMTIARRHE